MVSLNNTQDHLVYSLVKRAMDIGAALLIIALFWWLFVLCWAMVRFSSAGHAIFRQERVGHGEKLFICYKFRTMYQGTKQGGTHEMSKESITPIGKYLRLTRLDELPQIINILKGEMSLVGPRPCLPIQTELIKARKERQIFAILPGITGLAQVQGIDMSNPVKLAKMDARYLNMRSLWLDINILWLTMTRRHHDFYGED